MSDKLNETFQKHLKLLHEHLNINEGEYSGYEYGELRADLDGYKTDPRDKLPRYVSPEERAREKFSETVAGYARENGFDVNRLIRYLNLKKAERRNDWKETDQFRGTDFFIGYRSDKFDKDDFKRWAERDKEESDRDYERRRQKDKEEAPSREINTAASYITRDMRWLIHSIGTIKWQLFKLKNPEQKLEYLSDYFEKNKNKLTKDYFGRESYDDLKPYFDKYSNNDEKAKLILLAAIKASEKQPYPRGFFEQ